MTRSFLITAPGRFNPVIIYHVRAGWCHLEEVEVKGLLKLNGRGSQVIGVLVVAREMAPERDGRAVKRLARTRCGQALTFGHAYPINRSHDLGSTQGLVSWLLPTNR